MTEVLERLSTLLTTAPPTDAPVSLIEGAVVSLTPQIRVDSGAMQLQCDSLVTVIVGDTVKVLTSGASALIIGIEREAWHDVATGVGFTNSWANFGGVYQPARFRKESGRVYVEGVIKNGTNGATAFTLPAGYRPANSIQRVARGADTAERFTWFIISAAGVVIPELAVSTGTITAVSFGFDFAVD